MPKKKASKELALAGQPDFSSILSSDLPISMKRRAVLIGLGLKAPRKKYKSPAERKAAAKERAKKKRAEKTKALKKYGLEPKPKVKKTKAEKRAKRSERGKIKRELFKEFARMNPEMAKKFGFDPARFKP